MIDGIMLLELIDFFIFSIIFAMFVFLMGSIALILMVAILLMFIWTSEKIKWIINSIREKNN